MGCRLAGTGNPVLTQDDDANTLSFAHPVTPDADATRLDLETGREAPLVGAHLLTRTPLSSALPPMSFRLATTRGTNALLEERGAQVALFVTSGFGDLLRIGDQTRPDLFALNIVRPQPLHAAVVEVEGRQDASGAILAPIDTAEIRREARRLRDAGITTACVALIHSYRDPAQEDEIANLLRDEGFQLVVTSAATSPRLHYGRRTETALIDAYLAPLMNAYLGEVENHLAAASTLRIMTSAGGLVTPRQFRPIDSLLSGPAGGIVGAAGVGRQMRQPKILAFDMGGTSTDVSRYDGHYHYQQELRVGKARLQSDALHIETIAAGGGSICTMERGGLRVGPESAGASPGPACYGAGGPLTITDVHALLGHLCPDEFAIPLDEAAVKTRWAEFLKTHDLVPEKAEAYLEGFLQIANERMANAIRSISIRLGEDPADYALLAFGGAGGLHACALAELLDIHQVIVPADAGVLSARGLQRAALEAQRQRQILLPLKEASGQVETWATQLANDALAEIELTADQCDLMVEGQLRFLGQEATLTLPLDLADSDIETAFHRKYERIFGHVPDGRPIELESMRVRVREKLPETTQETFAAEPQVSVPARANRQRLWMAGAWREVPRIGDGAIASGTSLKGPLLVTNRHYTLVVEPNWTVQRGSLGTLRLQQHTATAQGPEKRPQRPPEVLLELFTQRFRNVVHMMGDQLKKTAISTNVKERMDYSCCLLDAEGRLIANAPHIPVHLGAMGLCVRRVMATLPLRPGDVILTNHPAYGGSHLPDLTVIMPVFLQDQLFAFVANRAHHAEIGGIRPGSMPPNASALEEEGVILPPSYLFQEGVSRECDIRDRLLGAAHPTRSVEENLADLRAQVASCRAGAQMIIDLVEKHSASLVSEQLGRLYEDAATSARHALKQHLQGPASATEELDDGSRICVALTPQNDNRVTVDFAGTSPRHPANLHATPAIVRSALIYVIRLLQSRDLPLNEGLLDNIDVLLPPCFLNPSFDTSPLPPVVGGNVETSQRLVDTLLKAFRIQACSQGTMNNLIFGNDEISYYETICGGAGAGPDHTGASAVHTHMTNTAITDPEILEWRYPVRLRRFAVRHGSGGAGRNHGGCGVIRELEFLAPLAVSLLTQHRSHGPYGLHGGEAGSPGRQRLYHQDKETDLPALTSIDVVPGDRLRIETPGGGGWGKRES